MNANDVRLWNACNVKANSNGLKIELIGEAFNITKDELSLGKFGTLKEVYDYLCGYETGFSAGYSKAFVESRESIANNGL